MSAVEGASPVASPLLSLQQGYSTLFQRRISFTLLWFLLIPWRFKGFSGSALLTNDTHVAWDGRKERTHQVEESRDGRATGWAGSRIPSEKDSHVAGSKEKRGAPLDPLFLIMSDQQTSRRYECRRRLGWEEARARNKLTAFRQRGKQLQDETIGG